MRKNLLALAALGAVLAMPGAAMSHAMPTPQVNTGKKAKRALFSGAVYSSGYAPTHKSAGISVAQQKRASKKARNVRRHKQAAKR